MRLTGLRVSLNSKGLSLIETLVALVILGVGIAALIELYSYTLRSTKHYEDVSRAVIYARAVLDEAYAQPEPPETGQEMSPDGLVAARDVTVVETGEGFKVYSITVRVSGPERGKTVELGGKRLIINYEKDK